MNSATRRAALIGAVVGLLCVAAFVVVAVMSRTSEIAGSVTSAEGPVLVAIVLPDAEGVPALRALDVYRRDGSALRIESVDPLTSATVPGTSATSYAEAYAFGGGERLAAAYARETGSKVPAWLAVGAGAWGSLMGSQTVSVRLASGMDVFDGLRLYSYPAGTVTLPSAEVPPLMDGAEYVSEAQRKSVRISVGDALARRLVTVGVRVGSGIASNLPPEQLAEVLGGVKSPPIRADNPQ